MRSMTDEGSCSRFIPHPAGSAVHLLPQAGEGVAPMEASHAMPEIWFYHLQHQRLEKALPSLLEKALAKGWRVVVQASAEERLDALDGALWTYADSSFLAHGRARDGDAEMQPVWLTTGTENPNGAALRLLIEGADMPALFASESCEGYERLILLFDGADEDQLTGARSQWKTLKEQGRTLAYWQQGERGGWEQKA